MIWNWLIILLVVVVVAGVFGFTSIASFARMGARFIFYFLLVAFVVFFIANYLYQNVLK